MLHYKKLLNLTLLTSVFCGSAHAGMLYDSANIGIIYITNSTKQNIRLIAQNLPNASNYVAFHCFYPIPKDKQIIPSPNFDTITEHTTAIDYTVESSLIKKGETVAYAFNSKCDNPNSLTTQESFGLANSADLKQMTVFGNAYEDPQIHALNFTKRLSERMAIYGNIVAPNVGYQPFHITLLANNNTSNQ